MIRLFLLLALLGAASLAWPQFSKTAMPFLKKLLKNNSLLLIIGLLLFLTATGKLTVFLAACGAALMLAARTVPFFLRHIPTFQSLWTMFTTAQARQTEPPAASDGTMREEEAYKILGLHSGATEQEIILAHKRLMQKLHPDRGGSDYLATQINRAKAVLLKK